jgi:DNA-directed RNA polymerase subunit K/omega
MSKQSKSKKDINKNDKKDDFELSSDEESIGSGLERESNNGDELDETTDVETEDGEETDGEGKEPEATEEAKEIDEVEEDTINETEDVEEVAVVEDTVTKEVGEVEEVVEETGDDMCIYDVKKKFTSRVYDSDDFDDLFEDEKVVQTKKVVSNENRITKPILTKYERVRILGERRMQLVYGAKPMIKTSSVLSEKEISNLELINKVIPMIIKRTLPNGDIEYWKLSELEIVN